MLQVKKHTHTQHYAYLGRRSTNVYVHICKLIFQVKKYVHNIIGQFYENELYKMQAMCTFVWLQGTDLDDLQEQVGPGLSGPLLKLLLRGGWRVGGAGGGPRVQQPLLVVPVVQEAVRSQAPQLTPLPPGGGGGPGRV